jgi:hypothetical protein
VFLVDVSSILLENIPEEIVSESISISHQIQPEAIACDDPVSVAKRLYERYKKEAKLVITSRLHAAVPCMAAGIPVILARDEFTSRLTWIDRLLPVYDASQYKDIDWQPVPVNYEYEKKLIHSVISSRLKAVFDELETNGKISEFYLARKKRNYTTALSKSIPVFENKLPDKSAAFKYSLWGIGVVAESVYQYISVNYPDAQLEHIYDKNRKMQFLGYDSEPIEMIACRNDEFVIACPARDIIYKEMLDYLISIGKTQSKYLIVFWPN